MVARRGHPMTAATRAKISAALRGKHHPHKGHAISSATRAKISAALKGKPHPHKGHAVSASTRAKISAALRGKHHPHRGHPMTSATRAKISAALRARHPHAAGASASKRRPRVAGVPRHRSAAAPHRAIGHHPATARKTSTSRAAARAKLLANGGVIGTPQKLRHHGRHRPALLSVGRGYHRRTLTHLHKRHHGVHKLRIRRMTINHRLRPRRRA